MIYGMYIDGKDKKVEDAFFVRKKVFVEEQGIDPIIDFDNLDREAIHVVVYEDEQPVGTGRLIYKDNAYFLGRVCVLSEFRKKSYGDLIVKMLLDKAFRIGVNKVYCHAQLEVKGFYEKIGFKAYGKSFEEAGIDHIHMVITEKEIIKCSHCRPK